MKEEKVSVVKKNMVKESNKEMQSMILSTYSKQFDHSYQANSYDLCNVCSDDHEGPYTYYF